MATKIIIPRASGEGGIGDQNITWGEAQFNRGFFAEQLNFKGKEVKTEVTQQDVTQHQSALSIDGSQVANISQATGLVITENQISDFGTYLTQVTEADVTGYQGSLVIGSQQITGLTQANITEADITGHQAALSIAESQISDLGNYATGLLFSSVSNTLSLVDSSGNKIGADVDLSSYIDDTNLSYITGGAIDSSGIATFTRDDSSTFSVDFSTLLSQGVSQSDVTNHQAALSITESQISDLGSYVTSGTLNPILYQSLTNLPAASSNHGAIAHVHAENAMFFAHAGSWNKLASYSDLSSLGGGDAMRGDNVSEFVNDTGYLTQVTEADVTGHQAALLVSESQISDLGNYATGLLFSSVSNTLSLVDSSGNKIGADVDLSSYIDDTNLSYITGGAIDSSGIATFTRDDSSTFSVDFSTLLSQGVSQSDVTNHQAALSITESQISDLGSYVTSGTLNPILYQSLTNLPAASSNHGAIAHVHAENAMFFAHAGSWNKLASYSDLSSLGGGDAMRGDNVSEFVNDTGYLTQVTEADVTGHQAALLVSESQISDLGSYITQVTEADVTGHQAALSVSESQISDLGGYITQVTEAHVTGHEAALTIESSQISDLGTSATVNIGTNANNIVQLGADAKLPAVDGSNLTNLVSTLAGLTDLTISNPSNEDVVKYNGSAWVNGQASIDVDTPLSAALRGTDDVHIGAHPEQSTKVMDSVPEGNAFMVADASGLKFLVKEADASVFVVKGPSASPVRLAEASELPSFSLTKDSGEPDVEITDSDGEVYSVISGDSDSLGTNGLPIRQGYQFPSIGSNPSPLLISGGTIS